LLSRIHPTSLDNLLSPHLDDVVAVGASSGIHINTSLPLEEHRNIIPLPALPFSDSQYQSSVKLIIPNCVSSWFCGWNIVHSLPTLARTKGNKLSSLGAKEDRSISIITILTAVCAKSGVSAVQDSVRIELLAYVFKGHSILLEHIDDGNVLRIVGSITALADLCPVSTIKTTLEQCGVRDFILRNQNGYMIDSPIVLASRVARLAQVLARIVEVLVTWELARLRSGTDILIGMEAILREALATLPCLFNSISIHLDEDTYFLFSN
jgi:hypothetical protein